ncbi:MAG TPA: MarR family transcriptional regulator [Solirubrobacterales bacterium]|nr:MarR family transcriptional regulator [Solirubrobacterales bacterium]
MSRPTKLELIQELIEAVRANQLATDKMDEAAARGLGVNRTDARCLDIVERLGPISAGGLATEAGLTTGAVTAVIDRLVDKEYLRRVADPDDRRRVLIEVTERLEQRAGRYYAPLAAQAFPMLSRHTLAELETIVGFLEESTEMVERRAAEIRAELD